MKADRPVWTLKSCSTDHSNQHSGQQWGSHEQAGLRRPGQQGLADEGHVEHCDESMSPLKMSALLPDTSCTFRTAQLSSQAYAPDD